jgi:hypothetical protein
MTGTLTQGQADALAERLDLGLDGICLACLSFVSFAIERGEPAEIASQLRRMTPELWDDGLAERALASVHRLVAAGEPHADDALAELERRGGRSTLARAIVRRLASELVARVQQSRT